MLDARTLPAGADAIDLTARLPRFIDGPPNVVALLQALAVLVVGSGSVGMRVIDCFARLGIRALLICDGRSTKPASLATHPIAPEDVGAPKARFAAVRAKAIAPGTVVRYFAEPFELLPVGALVGASVVVIATDNLAAEVAVTQACTRLGVPLVHASVYGPALVAQVRAVGYEAGGACLACSYTRGDWDDLDAGTRFPCDGDASAAGSAPEPSRAPTVSLPHLCSLAADLAVDAVLQRHLELGPAKGDGSLEYCGYHGGTTWSRLARNPDCLLEHEPWSVRSTGADVTALTPRDLARIAGYGDRDIAVLSFRVERHLFASHTACNCVEHPWLGRFQPAGASLAACHVCGGEQVLHPLYTHDTVPGSVLAGCLDRSLAGLGVKAAPSVLVHGPRGATLVRAAASFPAFGQEVFPA